MTLENKIGLAKIAPEMIEDCESWPGGTFSEHTFFLKPNREKIGEREWLYICHLIENKLRFNQMIEYVSAIRDACHRDNVLYVSATEDMRAAALIRILGEGDK